ncbi:MAG TPA: dTMP kinase [bacterium]|nr:dTMP kinase [bacterium]
MTGKLISIEGIEGAGKSTVAGQLADRLREAGHSVLELREPGSTPVGESLRTLLKDGTIHLAPLTEAFLFEAARHELVVQRIRPALAEGQWVVVDRFYDSTTAYQGWGRGLDVEMLCRMHMDACGETTPDLTILLDIDPAVGLDRARSVTRGQGVTARDRFEEEGISFLKRIREGFLAIARAEPNRIVVISVTGDADEVVQCCLRVVEEKLGRID